MNTSFLDELNESQRKAVETTEGYIRLTAGAGSGKTRALVSRYLYLTDIDGISPDNILCITFTRKAADEMKKRIRDISTTNLEGALISTYHGFCYKVIREDAHRLHLKKEFEIIDDNKLEKTFRDIYKDLNLTIKDGELKSLQMALFQYKSNFPYVTKMTGLSNYTYAENVLNFNHQLSNLLSQPNYRYLADEISRYSDVLGHYLARQVEYANYDFFDLLEFTLHLFETDPYVLDKWQSRLEYIMVDEFQDSSPRENTLISYLAGKHQNLFVVGDPDQSIYSFKGGDISVFLDFNKNYTNVIDLQLYENYRSTQQIVEVSNQLISKNEIRIIDKLSIPKRGKGEDVTHFHCKKDKQEMQFIVDEINKIIKEKTYQAKDKNIPYSWKNIAVIVRSHRSKKPIETAFVKAGFPYAIADGIKFYAKKEIQTAIAYIKMIENDCNESFLKSIKEPKRRVGEILLKKVEQTSDLKLCSYYEALKYLQQTNDPDFNKTSAREYIEVIEFMRTTKSSTKLSTLIHNVLKASGYLNYLREGTNEQRIINVEDLIDSVLQLEIRRQQDVPLSEYIDILNEHTREADEDEEKDEIQIMTIHSSKGLEFKAVFLPHFNDGSLPNAKSLSDRIKLEEDRRLAYVAFTRAEDLLYITESEGLTERGSNKIPSRFLFDFDRSLLNEPFPLPQKFIESLLKEFSQSSGDPIAQCELNIGDKVKHHKFGIVTIKAVTDANYIIQFGDPPIKERTISKNYQFLTDDFKSVNFSLEKNSTNHNLQVSDVSDVSAIHHNSVQHPLWGIGFITSSNESYFQIRFPEINETKEIPKSSKAIKFI